MQYSPRHVDNPRTLSFRFRYQPIIEASTGAIFAYEALCRPTEGTTSTPEMLRRAAASGRLLDLGWVMRDMSLAALGHLNEGQRLFINVNPSQLDERLLDWAEIHSLWADRIVLEITEAEAIVDVPRVRALLRELRTLGYGIALDDLGAGYASLAWFGHLEPDFVKLDKDLVRQIGEVDLLGRLARHLVAFANEEGIRIVAEGIESPALRQTAEQIGVHLLQGYLFGLPAERIGETTAAETTR